MSSPLTLHLVAHTHWDRAWYWTLEQTRVRLVDLFDGLLELLEREPRYRCFTLDGQTAMIDDYLAVRPQQARRIEALARAGRLFVGPLFVLPDLFIPDGESLLRNLARGAARASEIGGTLDVAYLPDPFGHPEQLPQLLSGFGLSGLLVARGVGDEGEQLGSDFIWRAPDGSALHVTHVLGGGYCNLVGLGVAGEVDFGAPRGRGFTRSDTPWTAPGQTDEARAVARVARRLEDMRAYCPHGQLLLMNGCDHRHPQPELPRLLDAVTRELGLRVEQGSVACYQRAVRAAWRDGRAKARSYRGELRGGRYANLLSGVLSARVDIKLAHDRAERELLRWAEPLSAIAGALDSADDQRAQLAHAWREVLLCQPHDDICGCSVDGVHDDDHDRLRRAHQSAELLAERAARRIARVIDGDADSASAYVINPHPFTARALLRGERSRRAPDRLVELPPLAACRLDQVTLPRHAAPAAPRVRQRSDGSLRVDNGALSLRVGRRGRIDVSWHHAALALRDILRPISDGDAGDSYDFAPPPTQDRVTSREAGVQLLRADAHCVEVRLRHQLMLPVGLSPDRRARSSARRRVPFALCLRLVAGSPLLEVEVALDNRVDDHRLALALPLPLATTSYLAGSPFALTERPFAAPPLRPDWMQPPAEAQPFQHLVLAEDKHSSVGVALAAPGLREIAADAALAGRGAPVALRLTLLRSVAWLSRPDLSTRPAGDAGPPWRVEGARQRGPLTLRLALMSYARGERGQALQACRLHADPPRLLPPSSRAPTDAPPPPLARPPSARIAANTTALAADLHGGLLAVEPDIVQLSALTPAGDGALDARLVNLSSRRRRARLLGPFEARGRHVDLRGELGGELDRYAVSIEPWQIRTVRLSLLQ